MGYIIDFLINWGYWGMLVSAFLAGSFFPFSSEVVMSGLQAAGLDPIPLVIYGSIGNVLGSLFNYGVGRLGKMEWIEKYLHVKKEKLDQAERFMADRGAKIGMKAKKPIQAPRPAMNLSAWSSFSFFTCRYFSIHSIFPSLPTP